MDSAFAFCLLLLVFAVAGLREVETGEFDGWETDYAIIEDIPDPYDESMSAPLTMRGIVDKIKALRVLKKCDCTVPKVCGCCVLLMFENEFSHKGNLTNIPVVITCFNMTEEHGCMKSVELSMVLDSKKIYTKSIMERERCAKVPFTARIAKVCLNLYNLTMDEAGFHVCAKFNLKLFSKEAVALDFQCLLVANRTIVFEKPSGDPNTALLNLNIHKNLTVPHVVLGRR